LPEPDGPNATTRNSGTGALNVGAGGPGGKVDFRCRCTKAQVS
jgi:hypothetical protein